MNTIRQQDIIDGLLSKKLTTVLEYCENKNIFPTDRQIIELLADLFTTATGFTMRINHDTEMEFKYTGVTCTIEYTIRVCNNEKFELIYDKYNLNIIVDDEPERESQYIYCSKFGTLIDIFNTDVVNEINYDIEQANNDYDGTTEEDTTGISYKSTLYN